MTKRRERAWRVEVDGFDPITTGELTVDEAALCEKVSGVPWTLMNPLASVTVAKALLVVMLKRSRVNAGTPVDQAETEAIEAAGAMPVGKLHGAFTYVEGDDASPATRGGDDGPPSSGITSEGG